MPTQTRIRSRTTSLGKRGRIVGYASLTGAHRMPLRIISSLTNVPMSTCSDIIALSKSRCAKGNASHDPCADENLKPSPNCMKGNNQILLDAQKQNLIELALRDATHC